MDGKTEVEIQRERLALHRGDEDSHWRLWPSPRVLESSQ